MAHILLVEPNVTLAKVYQAALERDGHDVEWRRTAETALRTFDETTIDLVVLEIAIAGHNGIEFLYELRSYTDLVDIPVIIHSTVRPKHFDDKARHDLNIQTVLYKPATSLEELRSAVRLKQAV